MSDIVERLRDPSKGSPRWSDTMSEAADEIERRRSDYEKLGQSVVAWIDAFGALKEDYTKLEAALRECVDVWRPLLADADLTAHENPAFLALMRADMVLNGGNDE